MARYLSKTLISDGRSLLRRYLVPALVHPSFACSRLHFSSKPQLSEIDLDSSSSSQSKSGAEYDPSTIEMMKDLLRRVIVDNAAPYWIPFIPGSSFWVPPSQCNPKLAQILDRKTNESTAKDASISVKSHADQYASMEFEFEEEEEEEEANIEVKPEVLQNSEDESKPGDEEH